MKHPIATLVTSLAPAPYGWAALSAALLLTQRILVVAVAVELALAPHARTDTLLVGGALAAIFALHGAVRGALRVRLRTRLHVAALDALLAGDVVRTSPLEDDDAQTAVHQGTHQGIQLLGDTLPNVAGDAIAALVLGTYVAVVQPTRVVIVGGVALIVATLAVVVTRRMVAGSSNRAWRAYSRVYEDLFAALGARLELIANGRDAAFRADAGKNIAEYQRIAGRSERLSAIAGRAPILAAAIAVAGALLLDRSVRGPAGAASLADIAVFATVVPAFLGLARSAHDIQRNIGDVRPLATLLSGPRRDEGGVAPVPSLPAVIAWRDVAYAYPGAHAAVDDPSKRPLVLEDLSIEWRPGQVLLLSGPNGSGKSTCVRLLLGLARPVAGDITIGGVDLFSIDLSQWRKKIAYLPQRPFLPERASVREAMKLLARDADDATLRAALERIDVWRALGGREKSPLEVSVGTLSAGQRQRVAVARVLATDAPLLILDEPDANLDADGIRLVAAILRDVAATRMVAVIAHTDQLLALGDTLVTLSAAA